jgi:hypothetical protein
MSSPVFVCRILDTDSADRDLSAAGNRASFFLRFSPTRPRCFACELDPLLPTSEKARVYLHLLGHFMLTFRGWVVNS